MSRASIQRSPSFYSLLFPRPTSTLPFESLISRLDLEDRTVFFETPCTLDMSRLSTFIIGLAVCATLFALLHLQRTYRARRWIRKQRDARLVSYQNHNIRLLLIHHSLCRNTTRC
jgi:hypothetical protein